MSPIHCARSPCLDRSRIGGLGNRTLLSLLAATLASTAVCIRSKLVRNKLFEGSAVPSILDVILRSRRVEELGTDLNPSLAELLVSFPQEQILNVKTKKYKSEQHGIKTQ